MAPSTSTNFQPRSVFHVLLGCGILGVLLLNIQDFGMTKGSLNQLIVNPHGGNYWLLTIVNAVFGNKMSALLTVLFGASILHFFCKSPTHQWFLCCGLICEATILANGFWTNQCHSSDFSVRFAISIQYRWHIAFSAA